MPTEDAVVVACLADVAQSKDRVRRRNGLKTLEKSIVPRLDVPSAISLIHGPSDERSAGERTTLGLGGVLLAVISDDDTSEICREKASLVLRECLRRAFEDGEKENPFPSIDEREDILTKFYADFCRVLHGRLAPRSPIGDDGGGLVGRAPPSSRGPTEPSEEIRLVLVQTSSDLLSYIDASVKYEVEKDGSGATSTPCDSSDSASASRRAELVRASSTLCRALASTGLADPYPDLKRASCSVLIRVAALFPEAVRGQAAQLLRPITGGAEAYGGGTATAGGVGRLGALTAAEASSLAAKSSSACMARHRHAKTRCLALEATAAVLKCCHMESGSGDDAEGGEIGKGSTIETNENILRDHVLPCWEDFPPFDRSAAVRMALVDAVGEVAVTVAKEFVPAQNIKNVSKTSPERMLVLLLMGMSDETENIRNAALKTLARLAEALLPDADTHEAQGSSISTTAVMYSSVAGLMSANSDTVLSVLLPCVNGNLPLERKIRGVQALEVLIRLVNNAAENAERRTKGPSPFTPITNDSDEYPLQPYIAEIILALCSFFNEEESYMRSAAISCGRALGANGPCATSVLALLLPAIAAKPLEDDMGATDEKASDEVLNRKKVLISSPRQHAAALTLLGCLVEGASIKNTRDAAESNGAWLSSYTEEISGTISNPRVLEVVPQDQCSAEALLEVCSSLINCADQFRSSGASHAELGAVDEAEVKSLTEDGRHCSNSVWEGRVVVDVLSCCFQLLGCPDAFGLSDQAMDLLESMLGCDRCLKRRDLLRLHFRDVLWRLLADDSSPQDDGGEASPFPILSWSADDRRFRAFEALLRYGGGMAVAENFDLVAPVLESLLADEAAFNPSSDSNDDNPIDYNVKLSAMALVESIVSDPLFPKDLLHPFTAKLLDTVIMPNLVWKVGGMASSLRKVSAAALFSLLRNDGATSESLLKPAPRLLPVLKSNLGDDDASTRELVVSSLAIIFELLPRVLGEDAVNQLYPDLVKCLDDSSDNVRFAACSALRSFFRAASPHHFKGTAIEYMVEQLLIHMDDPDRKLQTAVLGVLTVALDVDSTVVMNKAKEAQSSHRSSEFSTLLLQKANEKMAAERVMRGSA